MRLLATALSTVLLLSAASLNAANLDFLKNSAFAKFTKEDQALFNKAFRQALDTGKDGAVVSWKNDKTGSGGSIMPAADPKTRKDCRSATIANFSRTSKDEGVYVLCRNGDRWMLTAS